MCIQNAQVWCDVEVVRYLVIDVTSIDPES